MNQRGENFGKYNNMPTQNQIKIFEQQQRNKFMNFCKEEKGCNMNGNVDPYISKFLNNQMKNMRSECERQLGAGDARCNIPHNAHSNLTKHFKNNILKK